MIWYKLPIARQWAYIPETGSALSTLSARDMAACWRHRLRTSFRNATHYYHSVFEPTGKSKHKRILHITA